jgi:hypothetical protein
VYLSKRGTTQDGKDNTIRRTVHAERGEAREFSQRRRSIFGPWSEYRGSFCSSPTIRAVLRFRPTLSKAAGNRASHGFIKLQRNTAKFRLPRLHEAARGMRRWSKYRLGTPLLGASPRAAPLYAAVNRVYDVEAAGGALPAEIAAAQRAGAVAAAELTQHVDAMRFLEAKQRLCARSCGWNLCHQTIPSAERTSLRICSIPRYGRLTDGTVRDESSHCGNLLAVMSGDQHLGHVRGVGNNILGNHVISALYAGSTF